MFDYSEKRSFDPIEPGLYEAQITNAELKQNESGKNYIALTYTIREDVQQDFQRRIIWDNIWENDVFRRNSDGKRIKRDDYNAMSAEQRQGVTVTREYNDSQVRTIIQSQDADEFVLDANGNKIQNPNYKTRFNNIEEVVMFMNGLNLLIKVTKYMDDKSGNERNGIDYNGVKRTKIRSSVQPQVKPAQSAPQPQPVAKNTADDMNLPW